MVAGSGVANGCHPEDFADGEDLCGTFGLPEIERGEKPRRRRFETARLLRRSIRRLRVPRRLRGWDDGVLGCLRFQFVERVSNGVLQQARS